MTKGIAKVLNKDVQIFCKLKPFIDRMTDVYCSEEAFCSPKLKYGGTVDCVAVLPGKDGKDTLCVIDCKTGEKTKSKEQLEKFWLQTAAYRQAITETT